MAVRAPGPAGAAGPLGDASAAHLLTTVLDDYWYAVTQFVPSAALVALLAQFAVGEAATRAALSRLTRLGRLEGTRRGRTTAYRLAPALLGPAHAHAREVLRFGVAPRPWDGRWTSVGFSIPETERHRRPALRQRLRRLGLGPRVDRGSQRVMYPSNAVPPGEHTPKGSTGVCSGTNSCRRDLNCLRSGDKARCISYNVLGMPQ